MQGPNITLILGGTNSGKTNYAIKQAELINSNEKKLLYSNCNSLQHPMTQHQLHTLFTRMNSNWTCIDASQTQLDPLKLVLEFHSQALVYDCITFWMAQLLQTANEKYSELQLCFHIEQEINFMIQYFKSLPVQHIYITSNEVGMGVVPAQEKSRHFRNFLGLANTRLSEIANNVFLLISGNPLVLKKQDSKK